MKKLVSFVLAVIAVLCLSVPAFATEVTEAGDYTAEVTGSYIAGTEGNNTVYCVDITWDDLDMTYHAAKEAVWDTDNLEYSVVTPAYWDGEGTITVINRSNIGISATPTYSADADYSNANMTFSTDKLRVSTAEFGTEHSGTITVTPTGWLPSMDDIGTITLTIAKNTDITAEEATELLACAEALFNQADNYRTEMNYENLPDGFDDALNSLAGSKVSLKTYLNDTQEMLNSVYSSAYRDYYRLKGYEWCFLS